MEIALPFATLVTARNARLQKLVDEPALLACGRDRLSAMDRPKSR